MQQTVSGAHALSYQMSTGDIYRGPSGKGMKVTTSYNAEVNNARSLPPRPLHILISSRIYLLLKSIMDAASTPCPTYTFISIDYSYLMTICMVRVSLSTASSARSRLRDLPDMLPSYMSEAVQTVPHTYLV